MLFYANFEDLDLSQLDSYLREKIVSLHFGNEKFYEAIKQENLSILKEYLELGYPLSWKEALKLFTPDEAIALNGFIPPDIPNNSDCTDDMGICFDNHHRDFDNIFYRGKIIDFNHEMVELLASYFFKNKKFRAFNFFYLATAKDKELAKQYIENKLKNSSEYPLEFNGLLFNPDSEFFDFFMDFKKEINLKKLVYIFEKPQYSNIKNNVNEIAFKKAFDVFIDELIDEKLNTPKVKNVAKYSKTHAVNEIFSSVWAPENLKNHIYSKYEKITGVDSSFTPVALAWSEVVRIDVYFELEWEGMPKSFKDKYPRKEILSSGNEMRKKNFLERETKKFKEVFDKFCQTYDLDFVAEQSKALGIPAEYYPEIYSKTNLEKIIPSKSTEQASEIKI